MFHRPKGGGMQNDSYLTLFFEGQTPTLVAQILKTKPTEIILWPSRFSLLSALVLLAAEPQILGEHYKQLLDENDLDACCACVGGALALIWQKGTDFRYFAPWLKKADYILRQNEPLSDIAKAYLLLQKGLAETFGTSDLNKAQQTYAQQKIAAEKARSHSLQLIGATLHAYCFTWNGALPRGQMILLDAAPLAEDPDVSPLFPLHHQMTLALNKAIQGHPPRACEHVEQILKHPLFTQLPATLQLQIYGIQLDIQVIAGQFEAIDQTSEKIRALAIPEQNNYFRSYLNFCLGMASLTQGRPARALGFAEEAIYRAECCLSAAALRMSALLYGQTLADLGQIEAALKHLERWHQRWINADYTLIAILGCLETSNLYQRQGKLEKARQCWHQAHSLLPTGEPMYHLYRPKGFYTDLHNKLFPPEPKVIKDCTHSVRITTLGSFALEINGRKIFDHQWRGQQSKVLLKVLIALGGKKISTEKIAECIWPDIDGDKALNSLNVTLSRLRKIGLDDDVSSLPWVVSKHKKLSLSKNLCCIDALIFHETIKQNLKSTTGKVGLKQTLESYTGNFLSQDTNIAVIELFRTELLNLYVKGVLKLSAQASEEDDFSEALTYLETASYNAPTEERLYAEQIKLYLRQQHVAKARDLYHHACAVINSHLNRPPGPTLQALGQKIEK